MTWDTKDLEEGPVPLWFQIAGRLRESIATGEFKPGDALPSEARINDRFSVSRTTARASLDKLEQEGLISRHSGRGSIVLRPRVEQPLSVMSSFAEDMRRRGLRPSYRTFDAGYVPASAEVANALGREPASLVYRTHRLFLADDQPIGISESWITADAFTKGVPPDKADLDAGSLYQWLERRNGIRIAGGREIIEAAVATRPLAKSLDVRVGAPLLVARRFSDTAEGDRIEYCVMCFRADRYRFHVEMARP